MSTKPTPAETFGVDRTPPVLHDMVPARLEWQETAPQPINDKPAAPKRFAPGNADELEKMSSLRRSMRAGEKVDDIADVLKMFVRAVDLGWFTSNEHYAKAKRALAHIEHGQ